MSHSNRLLDEIHAARDTIAQASENSLQRIAEAAKAREKESGHKVVRLGPKRSRLGEKAS